MKNIIRSIAVFGLTFMISQAINAQPAITIEGFGGWLWTGSAGYNTNIKVGDKANYGVRAGVSPHENMVVEFEWNHTDTDIEWNNLGIKETNDVIMNYYMLGFNQEIDMDQLKPYGLFNIGVLNIKEVNNLFNENWFTVGLGGGLKYYFNDRLGIRLQARLLFPMQFAGIGFGCGGGGCNSGVSTYTSVIQGDFTGGVILKIGG